jgi:hypothetical protein
MHGRTTQRFIYDDGMPVARYCQRRNVSSFSRVSTLICAAAIGTLPTEILTLGELNVG